MRAIAVVCLLTLLLLPLSVWALTPQQAKLIKVAEGLIRKGECQKAHEILAKLQIENPADAEIQLATKDAYLCAGDFASARKIVEEQIVLEKSSTRRSIYVAELARIYLKSGDKKQADKNLMSVIELNPTKRSSYDLVAQTYMSGGFYNEAVKSYILGREKLRMPAEFATNLARLYEIMRRYGEAAREYFNLIIVDSTKAQYSIGKLRDDRP